MAILIGIDEAGYGPLLGPLVVSCAVFRLPDEHLRVDLWHLLQKAASVNKKGLNGRLLITDSKKAYTRALGIRHLQRTVLAALAVSNGDTPPPITHADHLIDAICPDCAPRIKDYPWYNDLHKQVLSCDSDDLAIAAGVFRRTLAENDMHLLGLHSRCLDVAFYNTRVQSVKNKSRVLFTEVCTLVLKALQTTASGETLQVVIDRQGGRINYQQELMRMFPAFELSVIRQSEHTSSYELSDGQKTMRMHFCTKADTKYLPVSLASMTSKYLREVLMESLNRFFCGLYADLKPTAGYWQDGQRFIRDLQTCTPPFAIEPQKLIRCQ